MNLHCYLLILVLLNSVSAGADLKTKIIGGFNVSSINEFKHQVSIRNYSHDRIKFGSGHICGGSLINYDTVLTAAHCLHDGYEYLRPSYYVVAMGNLDLFIRNNNTVVRSVLKIIGHAKYDPETFKNDIAVMKLNSPVPENHPTIKPITLSSLPGRKGQKCQASGWGTTEYQEENPQAVRWLMAVNISINSQSECNRATSHAGSVVKGQFCAGDFNGGKDTCQGDSGGPLSCSVTLEADMDQKPLRLVGVTSHGYECGRENYPGIYMDVAYYKNWIIAANSNSNQLSSSKLVIFYVMNIFLAFNLTYLKDSNN